LTAVGWVIINRGIIITRTAWGQVSVAYSVTYVPASVPCKLAC